MTEGETLNRLITLMPYAAPWAGASLGVTVCLLAIRKKQFLSGVLLAFGFLCLGLAIAFALSLDMRWSALAAACGALYAVLGSALLGSEHAAKRDEVPKVQLERATVEYAQNTQGHGIILTLAGKKEAAFAVSNVYLHVEGDELWQALGKTVPSAILTVAKWSFLPLRLCPTYLPASSLPQRGQCSVQLRIAIGTKQGGQFGALHATIRRLLAGLAEQGDPEVRLRLEADSGLHLCTALTMPSRVLAALDGQTDSILIHAAAERKQDCETEPLVAGEEGKEGPGREAQSQQAAQEGDLQASVQ